MLSKDMRLDDGFAGIASRAQETEIGLRLRGVRPQKDVVVRGIGIAGWFGCGLCRRNNRWIGRHLRISGGLYVLGHQIPLLGTACFSWQGKERLTHRVNRCNALRNASHALRLIHFS